MKYGFLILFSLCLASCSSTSVNVQKQFDLELSFKKVQSTTLLKQRKYSDLITLIENLGNNYIQRVGNEMPLFWEIDSVGQTKIDFEKEINEFVSTYPNSYIPYYFRAAYYSGISWQKRGMEFMDKTSKSQVDGFKYYKSLALEDINKAISINSNLSWLYREKRLILVGQRGMEKEKADAFDKALALRPESYMLWNDLLHNSTPRWGGSINLMQSIVNKAQEFSHQNPKLKELAAAIQRELGDQAKFSNNLILAEKYYKESLLLGDHSWTRYNLANVYFKQRKNTQACQQIFKGLKLRPTQWILSEQAEWCTRNNYVRG
ncbi:tetratricopeptide repeat protein [Algibacillus agarilyticus]|uniref:tetratricopeptide repeat protein n=1 Tax=Algibacillus agarilyticus TaxID=2234133 RepID=UPI000DCFD85A|nr:hypothetical protein [Algibacillus agarilyticus]